MNTHRQPTGPPAERESEPPSGRLADIAALLPILGAFLLASPVVQAVAGGRRLGAPSMVWYIFGAWAALIIAAAVLSSCMPRGGVDE